MFNVGRQTEHYASITAMDLFQVEQTKAMTGSQDHCVKVWDMALGDLYSINTYRGGHSRAVTGLSSCPTSPDKFVSCSRDRTMNIWDRRLSAPILDYNESNPVGLTTIYWSADNEIIFVGDEAGWIHSIDSRMPRTMRSSLKVFDAPIHRLRFNGSQMIVIADAAEVKVVDVATDLLIVYANDDAKDYVRDAHWTSSTEFRTIGWDSAVRAHSLQQ